MYRTILVADSIRSFILPSSPPKKIYKTYYFYCTEEKLKKSEIKAHVFAAWSHRSPRERDSS